MLKLSGKDFKQLLQKYQSNHNTLTTKQKMGSKAEDDRQNQGLDRKMETI